MRVAAFGFALLAAQTGLAHPSAAMAAEPVEVHYDVFWGGFHAAEAQVIRVEDDSRLTVHASGMMQNLSAFVLEAEARHRQFSSRARSRHMESVLEVDFSATPRTVIDEIRRSDDDDDDDPRPPVPEGLKAGTLDPLSALMQASEHVLTAAPGESFTVPVFDGRNRYDVGVAVEGPADADISGRHVTGIKARLEFKPLAGFRPRSQEMWDGARFTVLLDPATRLPARIVSENFAVGTVISAVPVVRKTGG